MFESCYVLVSYSLNCVRALSIPTSLVPFVLLSHSLCDTSLSKSPTTMVDLTHLTHSQFHH